MAKKYVVKVSDGYSKVCFSFPSAVSANNFALGALERCVPSDNKYRDEDGVSVKIYIENEPDEPVACGCPVDEEEQNG